MNWLMRKVFGRNFITDACQQAHHDVCLGECGCCTMPCRCPCHKTPNDDPVEAA